MRAGPSLDAAELSSEVQDPVCSVYSCGLFGRQFIILGGVSTKEVFASFATFSPLV